MLEKTKEKVVYIQDNESKKRFIQNIRIIEQNIQVGNAIKRDKFMAENIKWIYENYENPKIIVSAHNFHISKWNKIMMGNHLNEEFGENYALLSHCFTESQFSENDKVADTIIKKKNLNPDIISFLYQPDTEGKISYKICKQIYDIIKDVDFKEKSFRYATLQHNDYEEFKLFLKDCYSHRKQMRWS